MDRLFYLLSIISGLVVIVVRPDRCFLLTVLPRIEDASRPRARAQKHEIEIGWTAATLFPFLFLFWWAASDQLTALTPPNERAGDSRHRQTMDVALSTPERRARNRRVACAGGHESAACHDVRKM